jgi:hypothetical protein
MTVKLEKDGSPIRSEEDWFRLAPPKGGIDHWVLGRSARECARAWCGPEGPCLPSEVAAALRSRAPFSDLEIEWATPEYKVRFDRIAGEPRNADVVAVGRGALGKIAVSIEAKADEPFDLTVREVLERGIRKIASDQQTQSIARVQALAGSLLPARASATAELGQIRYQLLTATAGAIAFAIEQDAAAAILLVHEFHTDKTLPARHALNAADLDAFVARISGGEIRGITDGQLAGPIVVKGPLFSRVTDLYVGKAVRYV